MPGFDGIQYKVETIESGCKPISFLLGSNLARPLPVEARLHCIGKLAKYLFSLVQNLIGLITARRRS